MKRKRGRRPGKKYPNPRTTEEGIYNAVYGKLGLTEGMVFVRDCPYNTVHRIEKKESNRRDAAEKEYLKRAPKFLNDWAIRVGQLLGTKILAGDSNFFREIASAVDEYSKDPHPIEDIRRFLAILHRFDCCIAKTPFTSRSLREYYRVRDPGHIIDSSTLSRMVRWAQSAEL